MFAIISLACHHRTLPILAVAHDSFLRPCFGTAFGILTEVHTAAIYVWKTNASRHRRKGWLGTFVTSCLNCHIIHAYWYIPLEQEMQTKRYRSGETPSAVCKHAESMKLWKDAAEILDGRPWTSSGLLVSIIPSLTVFSNISTNQHSSIGPRRQQIPMTPRRAPMMLLAP